MTWRESAETALRGRDAPPPRLKRTDSPGLSCCWLTRATVRHASAVLVPAALSSPSGSTKKVCPWLRSSSLFAESREPPPSVVNGWTMLKQDPREHAPLKRSEGCPSASSVTWYRSRFVSAAAVPFSAVATGTIEHSSSADEL